MEPRIGINLWHRDAKNTATILTKAVEVGFNHAEVSIDYPFGIEDVEPFKTMCKHVKEYGMTLSVHAPWQEINLASPLREVREASIRIIERALRLAYQVESIYVVLHVTSAQPICKSSAYRHRCISSAVEALNRLATIADELGLLLAVENVGDPCCGRIDQFSPIIAESRTYACIDIAHALLHENNARNLIKDRTSYANVLSSWIDSVGRERVLAIHVHTVVDRNGKLDPHNIPDENLLDIKALSKVIAKSGVKYIVFEAFKNLDGKPVDVTELAQPVSKLKSWLRVYA